MSQCLRCCLLKKTTTLRNTENSGVTTVPCCSENCYFFGRWVLQWGATLMACTRSTPLTTTPTTHGCSAITGAPTAISSGTTESPFPKRRPSMPGAVALQTRVNTWIGTSCGGKLGAGTVTTTTRIRTGSCGVDCSPSTLRAIAVADQIVTAFKSPRTRTTRGPHRTHRTIGGCCERFTPFSNRTSNTRLEWKVLPTAAWCTCCSMDKDVSWNKS